MRLRGEIKRLRSAAQEKETEPGKPIQVGCTVRHKKQGWTAQVESIFPPGPPREATALLDNGQAWCFSQLEHLEPAD